MNWYMRVFGRVLATLLLIAGCGVTQATELLGQVSERVGQAEVIRADFEQTKQMAVLKRPLVTRGRLVFSRRDGVLWLIETPYRIGYVLSETKIVEIAADGTRRVREAKETPGLAQVGRVFRAMLGANPDALREYFDVGVDGDTSHWRLSLTPRQPQLAQYLGGMALEGSRFVDQIRIDERRGDTTRIVFSRMQEDRALNESERAAFGDSGSAGR